MGSLVLLRETQTAVNASRVDPVIVAAAVLALAGGAAAAWLPLPGTPLRAFVSLRSRRQAVSLFTTVVVLLALLPSILPYDHFAGTMHASGAAASGGEQAVHASHCHVTPGTCSDAPVSSGGQLLTSAPLAVAPAMLAVLIAAAATVLVGVSFRPEIRPPLLLTV